MTISLEDALLTVWQQSLVENKKTVALEDVSFPVRSTAKRNLKQIDFRFEGRDLRGLEQNPETKSRWAAMARSGKKVMQFLEGGRYIAVVVDGKVHVYPGEKGWRVDWKLGFRSPFHENVFGKKLVSKIATSVGWVNPFELRTHYSSPAARRRATRSLSWSRVAARICCSVALRGSCPGCSCSRGGFGGAGGAGFGYVESLLPS